MSRRTKDWNEGLAEQLKDTEFAREFILASLEEGLSLQDTLKKVILAYGLKEFSKKVKMPAPNISRALNPRHNPTLDTLNRLLKPFRLHVTIAPLPKRTAA